MPLRISWPNTASSKVRCVGLELPAPSECPGYFSPADNPPGRNIMFFTRHSPFESRSLGEGRNAWQCATLGGAPRRRSHEDPNLPATRREMMGGLAAATVAAATSAASDEGV